MKQVLQQPRIHILPTRYHCRDIFYKSELYVRCTITNDISGILETSLTKKSFLLFVSDILPDIMT